MRYESTPPRAGQGLQGEHLRRHGVRLPRGRRRRLRPSRGQPRRRGDRSGRHRDRRLRWRRHARPRGGEQLERRRVDPPRRRHRRLQPRPRQPRPRGGRSRLRRGRRCQRGRPARLGRGDRVSAPGSGPSAGFPAGPTAVTDAAGRARVPVIANGVPGAFAVSATVPGATTSFALLNTGRFVAVGADAGGFPELKLYDALTGRLHQHFLAYPASFRGGVRVALGDLTGDGVPEIVTAPGPGAPPLVKVFDGASGVELGGFLAYDPAFQGGVFVAAGDLTGDGHADLVTGAGPGGPPHVKVFSGAGGDLLASFFAYDPAFQGGVRVAVTDVTGDGVVDLLTVAGPGAPAFVRVFATSAGGEAARGFVFDPAFAGGAFVNGQ